ncbi:19881_t:CDS:1, partial [Gigaspora rosea]
HLNNISPPDFGEAQILAEVLACGYENMHFSYANTDQTIFGCSCHLLACTFYKTEIPVTYWKEHQRSIS